MYMNEPHLYKTCTDIRTVYFTHFPDRVSEPEDSMSRVKLEDTISVEDQKKAENIGKFDAKQRDDIHRIKVKRNACLESMKQLEMLITERKQRLKETEMSMNTLQQEWNLLMGREYHLYPHILALVHQTIKTEGAAYKHARVELNGLQTDHEFARDKYTALDEQFQAKGKTPTYISICTERCRVYQQYATKVDQLGSRYYPGGIVPTEVRESLNAQIAQLSQEIRLMDNTLAQFDLCV